MNTQHETDDYFRIHHPEAHLLHQIEWSVFGHVSFSKEISHAKRKGPRIRRFAGLVVALAITCEVKPRQLVFFQNNEVKPESDFHHVHFLLGNQNLEKFAAGKICKLLTQKATEFGFDDCMFTPFDPTKDGVGYVTKRIFRTNDNGRRMEIPPDFYLSDALRKLIKEKEHHE
jgi:hypothetical protein